MNSIHEKIYLDLEIHPLQDRKCTELFQWFNGQCGKKTNDDYKKLTDEQRKIEAFK